MEYVMTDNQNNTNENTNTTESTETKPGFFRRMIDFLGRNRVKTVATVVAVAGAGVLGYRYANASGDDLAEVAETVAGFFDAV